VGHQTCQSRQRWLRLTSIFFEHSSNSIDMTGRAPPLPALRAFAAWVRLGSVNAAAEELQLTPGAVSHQIRALEEFLNVPLIERNGRRWTLTDTGRIYGYQVRQALQDIVDVTERVRSQRHAQAHTQDLRVAVLPSFANGWLLPRLADFTRWHPQVRLQLHGSMDYVDLSEGQVDCAIRFGHGRWPEAEVRPLMGDSLLLLASPTLLGPEPPQTLQQLLQLPLLHASENWATWLADVPEAHSGVQQRQLQQLLQGLWGLGPQRRAAARQPHELHRLDPLARSHPPGDGRGAQPPLDRRPAAATARAGAGPCPRMPARVGLLPAAAAGQRQAPGPRCLCRLAARRVCALCTAPCAAHGCAERRLSRLRFKSLTSGGNAQNPKP